MKDAGFVLVAVSGALITLVIAALRIPGVARIFLIAQAGYWALSYLARPLVLLAVQPRPVYADNIADPRLAGIGYDRGIAEVLRPIAFGLWVYAAVVVAYVLWIRHRRGAARAPVCAAEFVPTFAAVYVIGLLGRAASYLTGSVGQAGDVQSSSPIMGLVAQLASIGAIGLIIFVRSADRRTTATLIGALLVMELLWTVAVESKTPIMSAAMALAVRFARQGWTRLRVAGIAGVAFAGVVGFGWLQSIKQPDTLRADALRADGAYPPSVQPFLSILRRFDLLESATDSYYMMMRPWKTPWEVAQHGFESLVPAQLLGSEKLLSGTAWAREVRGSSMDMRRVSVSLADGNINEGFVIGGYTGVVVGVIFTFGLLLLTVRALRSQHITAVVLGLAITASPILFERGILGSMEVIGKSLQLVVVVWIVDTVVREFRIRTEVSSPTTPEPNESHRIDA